MKLDVPAAVGLPLIAPLPALSVSPAGSAPWLMLNVYGGTPPLAVSAEEYSTPTKAGRNNKCYLMTGSLS